jgi:hypothetical protein
MRLRFVFEGAKAALSLIKVAPCSGDVGRLRRYLNQEKQGPGPFTTQDSTDTSPSPTADWLGRGVE